MATGKFHFHPRNSAKRARRDAVAARLAASGTVPQSVMREVRLILNPVRPSQKPLAQRVEEATDLAVQKIQAQLAGLSNVHINRRMIRTSIIQDMKREIAARKPAGKKPK